MNESGKTGQGVYLNVLKDILVKKKEILRVLLELTHSQEGMIASRNLEEDSFTHIVADKEEQIRKLNQLDHGFEQIYDKIRNELAANTAAYGNIILELQGLIREITEYGVSLEALEKQNKGMLDAFMSSRRKEIRSARLSNETVTSYYKTMAGQRAEQSHFYDKKN